MKAIDSIFHDFADGNYKATVINCEREGHKFIYSGSQTDKTIDFKM